MLHRYRCGRDVAEVDGDGDGDGRKVDSVKVEV